ncbi:MAG: pyrroloquinoline quinone biosynthesis protein PqqB [Polyangiales bacterium]
MKVRVLGSAAGGGFPQWNCGCLNCREARSGSPRVSPRTQECVAVSADGDAWFLLNASPEIRQQIESFPPLHPRGPRHSPIAGIALGNGDLDHCLGLLSLRESQPLRVYATAAMRRGFTSGNALYRTLERFDHQVRWIDLGLGKRTALLGHDGRPSGLELEPVGLPGKLPIHLEGRETPSAEDNVGLLVHERGTGKTLAYLSAVGGPSEGLLAALERASCVLFDGTFFSSDELIALGLGDKRAEQMAHWPLGGDGGSLALLSRYSCVRRILIHINNTNPMLRDDSVEAAAVRAAGVEIAYDGMEIEP